MARISLDSFIEGFAAQLVKKGQHLVRMNDPKVRDGLDRVYRFLVDYAERPSQVADKDWRRSIITIRNTFRPSPIGAFDRFETVMRAKQIYLTDHPNPFYQDIVIKLPRAAAVEIIEDLDGPSSDLVTTSVDKYLSAGAA